jgi:hypothetical protein
MTEMSPESISGYVTGEGCFYVESGYDKKYRLKHRIRPAFSIECRQSDRSILESIKETLGCGHVYQLEFGRYKGYEQKKWQPHVKLRVSNFRDISEKVVPFFQRYTLYGTKRRSFEVFAKVVEAMQAGRHLRENSLEEVKHLVRNLNSLNKKGLSGSLDAGNPLIQQGKRSSSKLSQSARQAN